MLVAIDTSTQNIGLALYDGVQVRHEAVWPSPNHHVRDASDGRDDAPGTGNTAW